MFEPILQHVARFTTLTEAEQTFFTSLLKPKRFRKHQYLLQEGDICRYEYYIRSGCVKTYYIDGKGNGHIIQFAIADWWTGDLHSMTTGTPSRLAIDAVEATEAWGLEKDALEQLYSTVPKFERYFRLIIQNAFIAQQDRILSNISATAEERYLSFIRRYPVFEQRIPQHMIASYLGITPESLSRIRKQLTAKR